MGRLDLLLARSPHYRAFRGLWHASHRVRRGSDPKARHGNNPAEDHHPEECDFRGFIHILPSWWNVDDGLFRADVV